MGCDIHAAMERKHEWGFERSPGVSAYRWVHAGEPDLGRSYDLFSILADVRNYDGIPPISTARGLPGKGFSDDDNLPFSGSDMDERPNEQFLSYARDWDADGHSHSWVTLDELRGYDLEQEVTDDGYVQRDDKGEIAYTYRGGSNVTAETERVGKRKVGDWADGKPGVRRTMADLIAHMEKVGADRLVFFFDN